MTLENLKYALILNDKMLLNRIQGFLHSHSNLEVLNGFSVSSENKLMFNNESICNGTGEVVLTDEQINAMVDEVIKELDQNNNSHHFSTEWTSDETNHWHVCTDENCTEISSSAAHSWNEGIVTKEPENDGGFNVEDGEKTFTCTVCGKTRIETVHLWDAGVVTKEAAAGVAGEKTFTCTVCGKTRIESIDPLPGPVITKQPDNLTLKSVAQGIEHFDAADANTGSTSISISCEASGDGLTYQWKRYPGDTSSGALPDYNVKNQVGGALSPHDVISGATTNTLSFTDLDVNYFNGIEYFYCTVTDSNGASVDTNHSVITWA